MKRITLGLFVASVALFLLSLANLTPGPNAAPDPKAVKVVGTVDVGNLPLASDGSLRTFPTFPSTQEIVIGDFNCPIFPGSILFELRFRGTPGVTTETGLGISRRIPPGVDPDTFCDALASDLAAKARSLGCATDQVGRGFICQGSRDEIVNAIGEIFRELL